MSFDLSRVSFDPLKDYLGVVMQQGRVQLDADWNEAIAQIVRRLRAGSLDTLGPAVVPRETPDGFLITPGGGSLTIGAGRIYVDGILAENHREPPLEWYRRLAELRGTGAVDYAAQPYYPDPPALPDGPYLVYLDVWQRAVTRLQDPELVEKAVGVDTTGRTQTVWQVKFLDGIGDGVNCTTPDDGIPGWLARTHPSSGRLTTRTGDPPDDPDPCLLPPAAGYRGLENQLYRVEIHDGGGVGTATFKWSRDNATVVAQVTAIPDLDRIVVDSIGRDDVLRFNDGDWVEITDDHRELNNLPGEIRRIQLGGGVDAATRSISLEQPLPAGAFPVDADGEPDPARHTRVRRWDQSGMVREADGSDFHDLDLPASTGVIPVPAAGTELFLEDGILVSFDLEPTGEPFAPEFESGDFWVFAARSADASLELLDRAPPRGIHHHYARLAVVDANNVPNDCRVLWPPIVDGESCDCTVCVHPEAHNAGTATIQQALDAVAVEGGTVCLSAGTYRIREPLRLANARSVRIRGQGWATILLAEAPIDVLTIESSSGVAIENLTALSSAGGRASTSTIAASNVTQLEIVRSNLVNIASGDATSRAVRLTGYALLATIRDSVLIAERGVEGPQGKDEFLGTANLTVDGCVLFCTQRAVSFDNLSMHLAKTRVTDNLVLAAGEAGIVLTGGVVGSGDVTIEGNSILGDDGGIVAGVNGLRILSNDIHGSTGRGEGVGIALVPGLDPAGIGNVHVVGNRVSQLGRHAMAVRTPLRLAMVKQNQVERVRGGAFVMEDAGAAVMLSLENNHFARMDGALDAQGLTAAGVLLQAVDRGDVGNNAIAFVARGTGEGRLRAGLLAVACNELRVSGNRVLGIGAQSFGGIGAGIMAVGPAARVDVSGNSVARTDDETAKLVPADWRALLVASGPTGSREGATRAPETVLVLGATALASVNQGIAFATVNRVVLLPALAQSVSVSGNYLLGEAANRAFVQVLAVQRLLMSGNDCDAVTQTERGQPVVGLVQCQDANVSNNRMAGGGDLDSMQIQASGFAIVGNMSTGNIRVNGAALPAPWQPLNIII